MTIESTRGRRGRLDQEAVLQAAEALVDRDGYDALTMTSLAAELEARVSSLYNHVANLEDLRALVQVRAMRMLGEHVRAAAMGHAGLDGLRALSRELRSSRARTRSGTPPSPARPSTARASTPPRSRRSRPSR